MAVNEKGEHVELPRRNVLTEADMNWLTTLIHETVNNSVKTALAEYKHSCQWEGMTEKKMEVLGDLAEVALESKEATIKAAKRTLKYVIVAMAVLTVTGMVIGFLAAIWAKIQVFFPGAKP